jgi:hypothetical protein
VWCNLVANSPSSMWSSPHSGHVRRMGMGSTKLVT